MGFGTLHRFAALKIEGLRILQKQQNIGCIYTTGVVLVTREAHADANFKMS